MPPDSNHDDYLRQFVSAETKLRAYVRTLVLNRQDAEDILQEVAIVMWRKYSQFTPGTNFIAWACRVAYHEVLHNRRRHDRSRLEFNDDLLRQIADEAEATVAEQDVREYALKGCMEKLPGTDLSLLRERYWKGVSGKALAQLLGRSESFVSRALGRIYIRLLDCIHKTLQMQENTGS